MAMRCFGRAFDAAFDAALAVAFLAAATRPLDLMVLRAVDLTAPLSPVHFFLTAVLAAALEVAFCLAIAGLPDRAGVRQPDATSARLATVRASGNQRFNAAGTRRRPRAARPA